MLLQIADLDISSTFRERSLFMSGGGGGGWLKIFKISIFFGSLPSPHPKVTTKYFGFFPKEIIIEDLTDECFCLQIPQFVSK